MKSKKYLAVGFLCWFVVGCFDGHSSFALNKEKSTDDVATYVEPDSEEICLEGVVLIITPTAAITKFNRDGSFNRCKSD